MLEHVKPEEILFIDIETVPCAAGFTDLDKRMQELWGRKSSLITREEQQPEEVFHRAGIYAEFGKIICISAGMVKDRNPYGFRIKSYFGDDEKQLLNEFSALLIRLGKGREITLCAHNGKEFDYPYLSRRMIINALQVPAILDNAGKKPWEVRLLDTMELWKFGDYKSYTSLDLLTTILGIASPKDDIDGSMICDLYWKQKDLKRIVTYCEKDVLAVAQVMMRFMNLPLIPDDRIESVTVF